MELAVTLCVMLSDLGHLSQLLGWFRPCEPPAGFLRCILVRSVCRRKWATGYKWQTKRLYTSYSTH